MSTTLYFYSAHERKELNTIWEGEAQWLDDFLHQLYESNEDKSFLKKLDSCCEELSLVEAHPIHQELCFDDLNIDDHNPQNDELKTFFTSCRSCLIFQNLPDFHLNPLQVSVVLHALKSIPLVLVDGFAARSISFGEDFAQFLQQKFKALTLEVSQAIPAPNLIKQLRIDVDDPLNDRIKRILLIMRGLDSQTQHNLKQNLTERYPKLTSLVEQLSAGTSSPSVLWQKSGLNAKDFSDGIERVYFFYHH